MKIPAGPLPGAHSVRSLALGAPASPMSSLVNPDGAARPGRSARALPHGAWPAGACSFVRGVCSIRARPHGGMASVRLGACRCARSASSAPSMAGSAPTARTRRPLWPATLAPAVRATPAARAAPAASGARASCDAPVRKRPYPTARWRTTARWTCTAQSGQRGTQRRSVHAVALIMRGVPPGSLRSHPRRPATATGHVRAQQLIP